NLWRLSAEKPLAPLCRKRFASLTAKVHTWHYSPLWHIHAVGWGVHSINAVLIGKFIVLDKMGRATLDNFRISL
ncbi:hypothetical protein, partial [Paraburkholderia humisilvae]